MTKASDTKIIDSGLIHLGRSDHSLAYNCRKVEIQRAEPKIVETRQFNSSAFQYDLKMASRRIVSFLMLIKQIVSLLEVGRRLNQLHRLTYPLKIKSLNNFHV